MSEPKDRSGSESGKTFDEAWESMPESSAESSEGGTRAWTEEVRAARKHDADATDEPTEEPTPPRTDKTMAWTDEVRGERKRDAPTPNDADEMDRLMRTEPTGAPPEEEIPPSASTSAMSFDALDLPAGKPDESLMDTLMGAVDASVDDAKAEDGDAGSVDEAEAEGDASDEENEGEEEEKLPPPIVLHPDRQAKPKAEPKREVPREPPSKPSKSRVPLLVGGTVAAALAVWFARDPKTPPKSPDAKSLGGVTKPSELDPAQPVPPTSPDVMPETEPAEPKAPAKPDRSPPKVDPDRDPREPPEGTPEEIAAVFKKLPVSPADRAPVGGVGKTGIHVDDVSMGSNYDRSRCEGGDGAFSVSKDDLANVCLRFVHQREKEEVSVVWQKVDGNARRGKIVVKPLHAYRTRAYLKLRSEYVGDWEVTVFSEDGVELARYPFTVVP